MSAENMEFQPAPASGVLPADMMATPAKEPHTSQDEIGDTPPADRGTTCRLPSARGGPLDLTAPSAATVAAIAETTLSLLADQHDARFRDVPIEVRDLPDQALLEHVGVDDPFDLLGRFENGGTETAPDRLFVFRRPLLDFWIERGGTLKDVLLEILEPQIEPPAPPEPTAEADLVAT